jgi:hypothetical protein
MKLDVSFKEMQSGLDIARLKEAVLNVTEEEWQANQFRQNVSRTARDVEAILFKLNGSPTVSGDDPSVTDVWSESWDKWGGLVSPIMDKVIKGYEFSDTAFINKCLLARMRPNMTIPRHIDLDKTFFYSHRLHVPILTNPNVDFIIGGERCVMEEGNAYEISNRDFHSVANNGDTDRVHLLFDFFIEKEFKHTRNGNL